MVIQKKQILLLGSLPWHFCSAEEWIAWSQNGILHAKLDHIPIKIKNEVLDKIIVSDSKIKALDKPYDIVNLNAMI